MLSSPKKSTPTNGSKGLAMANLEKIVGITLVLVVAMCCQTPVERAENRRVRLQRMFSDMSCGFTPEGSCVCAYVNPAPSSWAFLDPTGRECK